MKLFVSDEKKKNYIIGKTSSKINAVRLAVGGLFKFRLQDMKKDYFLCQRRENSKPTKNIPVTTMATPAYIVFENPQAGAINESEVLLSFSSFVCVDNA